MPEVPCAVNTGSSEGIAMCRVNIARAIFPRAMAWS